MFLKVKLIPIIIKKYLQKHYTFNKEKRDLSKVE